MLVECKLIEGDGCCLHQCFGCVVEMINLVSLVFHEFGISYGVATWHAHTSIIKSYSNQHLNINMEIHAPIFFISLKGMGESTYKLDSRTSMRMKDVLYVPCFTKNLLSISALDKKVSGLHS
jgi:hypothetical protein